MTVTPNVDVKAAVQAAIMFLSDINPTRSPEEVAVEEVEFLDEPFQWRITIGFYDAGFSMAAVTGRRFERKYKVFIIDANDGKVVSMKDRKP